MTAIKERGDTPFGEAGEGFFLRFTNADLRVLQEIHGKDMIHQASTLAEAWDLGWMESCLRHGLKGGDGDIEAAIARIDEEVSIKTTMLKVLNALFISYHGETFQEHVEKITKLLEEAVKGDDGRPTEGPRSTISTTSGSEPSDSVSIPKSSGASARSRSRSSSAKPKSKG